MAVSHCLQVEPRAENLVKVAEWIEACCKSHTPAAQREQTIQLVAEELFLNSVNHGNVTVASWIEFTFFPQTEGLALIIDMEGTLFDPFEDAPKPDVNAPLETRPIGGLGLMLVREMTDRATYEHVDGHNRLTLVFGPGPLPASEGTERSRASIKESAPPARCRPRSITFRMIAILLFFLAVGLTGAAWLNYLKYERILIETAAKRYEPVQRELESAINESLRSGLTLASIQTTQQLIDRAVARFEGAFELVVRNRSGVVLFESRNFTSPPATLPSPGEIVYDFSDPGQFVAHMAILQNGRVVGTLSLSHDSEGALALTSDIIQELKHTTMVSLVVGTPFLIIVSMLVIGRIEGQFHSKMLAMERAGGCKSRASLAEVVQLAQEASHQDS